MQPTSQQVAIVVLATATLKSVTTRELTLKRKVAIFDKATKLLLSQLARSFERLLFAECVVRRVWLLQTFCSKNKQCLWF